MVNAYAQMDIIRLTTDQDASRFIHQHVLETNTRTPITNAYAQVVKKLSTTIQDVEPLSQLVHSLISTEIQPAIASANKDIFKLPQVANTNQFNNLAHTHNRLDHLQVSAYAQQDQLSSTMAMAAKRP